MATIRAQVTFLSLFTQIDVNSLTNAIRKLHFRKQFLPVPNRHCLCLTLQKDEFECLTTQPGCKQMCFNKFSTEL